MRVPDGRQDGWKAGAVPPPACQTRAQSSKSESGEHEAAPQAFTSGKSRVSFAAARPGACGFQPTLSPASLQGGEGGSGQPFLALVG